MKLTEIYKEKRHEQNRKIKRISLIVLVIVLFLSLTFISLLNSSNTNSSNNTGSYFKSDPNKEDLSLEFKDTKLNNLEFEYVKNDAPISYTDKLEESSCFDCHDNFNPFDVELTIPDSVEADEVFQYEILVTNSDSETPHTVQNLEAILIGIEDITRDPYNNYIDSSIRRFQSNTHTFPVDEGASSLVIGLMGDDGVLGLNNIDLRLISPNGKAWSSSDSGVTEEILLTEEELNNGGAGSYNIEIQYSSGAGPISYSISIEVNYYSSEIIQFGEDLNKGDKHTFSWRLTLTPDEIHDIGSEVSGTVRYKHRDGRDISYRYTYEIRSDVIALKDGKTQKNDLLENGRIIGLLSLIILILILINGFSKTSRKLIAKALHLRNPHKVHCVFSSILILLAIIHAALLIMGPYSWDSEPSIFGTVALILFVVIAVSGFYRDPIISRFGKKKWRILHLTTSIIGLIIIIYHAVMFGMHFN